MIGCCRGGGEQGAQREGGRKEEAPATTQRTRLLLRTVTNRTTGEREREAGWMFMFASKTRKCSVITTWIGSDDNANRARGFNVEMDQINELPDKYHHGMLMV